YGTISNQLGTQTLGHLLTTKQTGVVCVSPIDWDTYVSTTPLTTNLTPQQPQQTTAAIPGIADVRQLIRKAAWDALGKEVDDDAVLLESGLDSLGSISLRNRIASDMKVTLPSAFALESPSIQAMARYVSEQLRARPKAVENVPVQSRSSDLPILVVGAGMAGIGFARRIESLGHKVIVLEKRDRVGGVWGTLANSYSKLQIDSPAYSFDSVSPALPGDHRWETIFPGRAEVIREAGEVASELRQSIQFNCHVLSVKKIGDKEYEVEYRQDELVKVVRVSGIAAFTGGLHHPKDHRLVDESCFKGHVGLGIKDDTPADKFADASVVIVGHGAFALENMRTALENGARHVTIIGRKRNLVVSTLCNWIINSCEGAVPMNDIVDIMRPFYESCGIDIETLPSLSRDLDGSFVLNQSTVPPASDLYFLAQRLGKVTVLEDEVISVSPHSVTTKSGKEVAATVLLKCLGSNTDQDGLLGMFGDGSHLEGPWVNGDANLFTYNDGAQVPRSVGSLLCSSYTFFVQALAEAYLHFRGKPDDLVSTLARISSESSGRSYAERLLIELWDFIEPAKNKVAARTLELCPFDRFQREREAEWDSYCNSLGRSPAEEEGGLWDLLSPALSVLHRRNPGVPLEKRARHREFGTVSVFVPKRHRVLFLPGQGTSARLSRAMLDRTGWLKRQDIEFVIPDAPFEIPAFTDGQQLEMLGLDSLVQEGLYDTAGVYREWNAGFQELWNKFHGIPDSPDYVNAQGNLRSTMRYVKQLATDYGPFSGIAGFCEGAAVASAALHTQSSGRDVGLAQVDFFIAMSPWRSPVHEHEGVFEKPRPIEVPVLQTVGEKDMDVFLAAAPIFGRDFEKVLEHRHMGQHVYPPLTRVLDQKVNRLLQERS
uniref:phosphopantetheine-binding protein n=1 Tax=Amycolatopsis sp. lyj-90 TaxID=2789285 RepID=UPI00397D78F2